MKFTKPINRDVDINDQTYVVTLDESGITFRVKGKRKSTQVAWTDVLAIAGEATQGSSQQESSGDNQRSNAQASSGVGSSGGAPANFSGDRGQASSATAQSSCDTRPTANEDEGVEATTDNDAELRHAAGAGERNSEG